MTSATPVSPAPATRFAPRPKRSAVRASYVLVGLVQAAVTVAALWSRVYAPGWWLAIAVMSGGFLVVLTPMVTASLAGAPALHARHMSTRIAAAAGLLVMDAALLTTALTFPDFTDAADSNYVPIVTLTRHEHVSENGVDFYNSIAQPAFITYVVAAGATILLFVVSWWRRRR